MAEPRTRRTYSAAERAAALAAYDDNGENLNGTARKLGIPVKTLGDWVKAREANTLDEETSAQLTIQKGTIAEKLERNLHLMIDAAASKIKKATLSQLHVSIGITSDKLRDIRVREQEADPVAEICRIMGYQRKQLPTSLSVEGLSPEDREFVLSEVERYAQEDGIDLSGLVRPGVSQNVIEMRETGAGVYVTTNSNTENERVETRIDPPASEPQQNSAPATSSEPLAMTNSSTNDANKPDHTLDPEYFGLKKPDRPPEPYPFIFRTPSEK
jgi:transposase-like protein